MDGRYNPDSFEDNDLATVTVNDKVLLVKMKSNGEFSVVNIWRYQEILPPEDVIEEMKEEYETSNYGEDEIVSWISRLAGYDGQKIFISYDRHSGQYDGTAQQSAASSTNAPGMSEQTGVDRKGVLEVSSGTSDGGDESQNQRRTNNSAKEWIINARGIRSQEREAVDLIEATLGEGLLSETSIEDYRAYERKNGGGKGTDSGASDPEVQLQRRTNTLSNREVPALAAEELRFTRPKAQLVKKRRLLS